MNSADGEIDVDLGGKVSSYMDWRSLDPALNFDNPHLSEICSIWEAKRGARGMPSRSDFSPEGLKQFLGNIMLIDVEYAPVRFRYRLIGTNIVNRRLRDSTGRYLDDLYEPEFYELAARSYNFLLDQKRPIRGFGDMSPLNRSYLKFEAVDLPLSENGEAVNMIMKCAYFIEAQAE